jgi:hypothetical protein
LSCHAVLIVALQLTCMLGSLRNRHLFYCGTKRGQVMCVEVANNKHAIAVLAELQGEELIRLYCTDSVSFCLSVAAHTSAVRQLMVIGQVPNETTLLEQNTDTTRQHRI